MSKAIADKCDVGCIITEASKVDLEQIQETAARYGLNPTHVIDIYKIRILFPAFLKEFHNYLLQKVQVPTFQA